MKIHPTILVHLLTIVYEEGEPDENPTDVEEAFNKKKTLRFGNHYDTTLGGECCRPWSKGENSREQDPLGWNL